MWESGEMLELSQGFKSGLWAPDQVVFEVYKSLFQFVSHLISLVPEFYITEGPLRQINILELPN